MSSPSLYVSPFQFTYRGDDYYLVAFYNLSGEVRCTIGHQSYFGQIDTSMG